MESFAGWYELLLSDRHDLFTDEHRIAISLALLVLMLFGFALERFPASGVATIGAAAFLALGFVDREEALEVFSNEAAITIGAMLILSASLVRTGTLEAVAAQIVRLAKVRPRTAVGALYAVPLVASGFMNSTPVVVVMIPLASSLASALGVSAKTLLIPLSYVAILGGTCTLLGTSTNLLIDSLVREADLPGFSIFEISGLGLIAAAGGLAFLAISGRRLLPDPSNRAEVATEEAPDVLTLVRVEEGFEGVATPYARVSFLTPRGVRLISARRGGAALDVRSEESMVAPADTLNLRVTKAELSTLQTVEGLRVGVRTRSDRRSDEVIKRVTLPSGSDHVGARAGGAAYLSRYAVTLLGVRRRRNLAGPDLDGLVHRPGDQLWLRGHVAEFGAMATDRAFLMSEELLAKPFLRRRAATSVATLAAVVSAAASGILPLAIAAIIGIGFLLLVRGMDTDDAWSALNLDVLVLIYAMLVIGTGLQNVGAVDAIVEWARPVLQSAPPIVVVACVYALTSILTEVVTNNAVAVVMTPLAIGLAAQVGIPPKVLVVAVMFAASASFATPVGYQTNTLVHNAGGYTFSEFLRIGVPMNFVVGGVTCLGIWALFL